MQDQHTSPEPLPVEPKPWQSHVRSDGLGSQWIYRFDNGFGASVVQGPYTYGGPEGLYGLGVLTFDGDKHSLTYETPITSDVIGHQTAEEIGELLARIAALPAAGAA